MPGICRTGPASSDRELEPFRLRPPVVASLTAACRHRPIDHEAALEAGRII